MHTRAELQHSLNNPEAAYLAAITSIQASLTELIGLALRDASESVADPLNPALEWLLNTQAHHDITTGLPVWDSVLGGWQPETSNILVERLLMGKSLFMSQLVQAATQGGPHDPAHALLFTLEDSPETLGMRALCRMAGISINYDRMSRRDSAPAQRGYQIRGLPASVADGHGAHPGRHHGASMPSRH